MWTDRTRLHECIDQIPNQMVAARAVIEHVPSGSIVCSYLPFPVPQDSALILDESGKEPSGSSLEIFPFLSWSITIPALSLIIAQQSPARN